MRSATSASEQHASRSRSRRPLRGLIAAFLMALVVAYPLLWTSSLMHAAVGGCWISCGEPSPGDAYAWGFWTALLLGAPISVGLHAAGVRPRRTWMFTVALVALALLCWVLFAHANPEWPQPREG
jgi:hypothetical protein